jgi:hypothetical protein
VLVGAATPGGGPAGLGGGGMAGAMESLFCALGSSGTAHEAISSALGSAHGCSSPEANMA